MRSPVDEVSEKDTYAKWDRTRQRRDPKERPRHSSISKRRLCDAVYRRHRNLARRARISAARKNDAWSTDRLYFSMTEYRERLEDEKKAALSASMRAASELPREEEAAENCADVRAA